MWWYILLVKEFHLVGGHSDNQKVWGGWHCVFQGNRRLREVSYRLKWRPGSVKCCLMLRDDLRCHAVFSPREGSSTAGHCNCKCFQPRKTPFKKWNFGLRQRQGQGARSHVRYWRNRSISLNSRDKSWSPHPPPPPPPLPSCLVPGLILLNIVCTKYRSQAPWRFPNLSKSPTNGSSRDVHSLATGCKMLNFPQNKSLPAHNQIFAWLKECYIIQI